MPVCSCGHRANGDAGQDVGGFVCLVWPARLDSPRLERNGTEEGACKGREGGSSAGRLIYVERGLGTTARLPGLADIYDRQRQ